MTNKYTVIREKDGDDWISTPYNNGDLGDLSDTAEELNRLRDALLQIRDAWNSVKWEDDALMGELLDNQLQNIFDSTPLYD